MSNEKVLAYFFPPHAQQEKPLNDWAMALEDHHTTTVTDGSLNPIPSHSPSYLPSPSRKRRAASPPLVTTSASSLASVLANPLEKRRRPNLANGFSGLSIASRPVDQPVSPLPTYDESQAARHEVDDDEVLAHPLLDREDILVEELRPSASRLQRAGSMSSSSTAPSDDYGSDGMYRLPGDAHHHERKMQQADEVEQPTESAFLGTIADIGVEDVTGQTTIRNRKRRDGHRESQSDTKRRQYDMDMDLDMDDANGLPEMDVRRRRRRTEWHEPEKDRKLWRGGTAETSRYSDHVTGVVIVVPFIVIRSVIGPISQAHHTTRFSRLHTLTFIPHPPPYHAT